MSELFRDQSGERTEQPTQLRLQEARRQGRVVRSADLASAISALGGVLLVAAVAPRLTRMLVGMTASLLDGGDAPLVTPFAACGLLWKGLLPILVSLGALSVAAVAIAVAGNLLQVGFVANAERIRPDLGRLSPLAAIRRFASTRSAVRAAAALVKIAAVVCLCGFCIRSQWPQILAVAAARSEDLAALAGSLVYGLAVRLGLLLVVLGVGDYLYRRWQHQRDLRITRRELTDDIQRMEGGRYTRSRRRSVRSQQARTLDAGAPGASVGILAGRADGPRVNKTEGLNG